MTEDDSVITVDINEGLKTKKEFRLSQVVKDVNYIPLETTSESMFASAGYKMTDNYILVYQQNKPPRLLLFDITGKFLRQIGDEGKGPGEYISMNHVYPEPGENWILLYDYQAKRIIKYGFDGNLIDEFDASEKLTGGVNRIEFLDGERIAVLRSRPTSAQDHYPLIQIYDYDFNLLEEKFFVHTEDLNATGWGTMGPSFYSENNRLYLREFYYDTLFVDNGEDFEPKFYFKLEGERPPGHYITFGPQGGGFSIFSYSAILGTKPLGHLLFLAVVPEPREDSGWYFDFMIFDPNNIDLYGLSNVPACSSDPEIRDTPGILNDIDGYIHLEDYTLDQETIYRSLEMLNLIAWMEEGCAYENDVKLPDKRDELTALIKSKSLDDNPILQVFSLK